MKRLGTLLLQILYSGCSNIPGLGCPRRSGGQENKRLLEPVRWRAKLASIYFDVCKSSCASCSSRASALKKHGQMWVRLANWLYAAYNVQWPTHVSMVVDFLEELAARPCGASVPQAFLSTLGYMERAGGIAVECRLASKPALAKCVDQLRMQLEQGSGPPKKARPQPLKLIALELLVLSENAPRDFRVFAWAKVIKFWTSSRSDDLAGLCPSSMSLDSRQRRIQCSPSTKTSGQKLRWLPIFVDSTASFAGVELVDPRSHLYTFLKSSDFDFDRLSILSPQRG